MSRCCDVVLGAVVYQQDGAHKAQIVLVHPMIGVKNLKKMIDLCKEGRFARNGVRSERRVSVPVGEQKHSRIHETCLNNSQPSDGGENTHNPKDKQSKVTITEWNPSTSSANTSAHACTRAHMHR